MVFFYRYFDFVIHPWRYLKFALYWTNTLRFDVEVKLWNINPEYAEVLCWLEDRSIRRFNVHRVTSSHLQKAYPIKIWLVSPSMIQMVFDSMTLESGYVTSDSTELKLGSYACTTLLFAQVISLWLCHYPCKNLYKCSANAFSNGPAFFQAFRTQLPRSFYSNMFDLRQE